MANTPFHARHGLNVLNVLTVNSTVAGFGANVVIDLNKVTVGNSTVNAAINSTSAILGSVTINTTAVAAGANVLVTTTRFFVGNSTANLIANSIIISVANSTATANFQPTLLTIGASGLNTTAVFLGSNVFLSTSALSMGNTTVNSIANSSLIRFITAAGSANLTATELKMGTLTVNSSGIEGVTNFTAGGNGSFSSLGVGTAAEGTTGRIQATENVIAYFSDRRLKKDFQELTNAMAKITSLTGYSYIPNELAQSYGFRDIRRKVGLLADEVAAILPEAIEAAPFDLDKNSKSKSGENYTTVCYERLIPLLVQGMKELNIRLNLVENNGSNS
jgi:hypothetical protein